MPAASRGRRGWGRVRAGHRRRRCGRRRASAIAALAHAAGVGSAVHVSPGPRRRPAGRAAAARPALLRPRRASCARPPRRTVNVVPVSSSSPSGSTTTSRRSPDAWSTWIQSAPRSRTILSRSPSLRSDHTAAPVGVDRGARTLARLALRCAPARGRRHPRRAPPRRPARATDVERIRALGRDQRAVERREQPGSLAPDVQLVRASRVAGWREAPPPDASSASASREHAGQAVMCRSKLARSAPDEPAVARRLDLEEPRTGAGAHDSSPSSSAPRSSRRAAWSRVHTVPIGHPQRSPRSRRSSGPRPRPAAG